MIRYISVVISAVFIIFSSCRGKTNIEETSAKQANSVAQKALLDSVIPIARMIVLSEPDSAIKLIKRVISDSLVVKDKISLGNVYLILARGYFNKFEYDSASFYYSSAYSILSESNIKAGMATAKHGLSYISSVKSDLTQSVNNMLESKRLFREANDTSGIISSINGLIYLYKQLNDRQRVDSCLFELRDITETLTDKSLIAKNYIILGNHYTDCAYLGLATDSYFKAFQIADATGDTALIANSLGNIGKVFLYLGQYKSSIDYYLKQMVILQKLKDTYELSNSYSNLGQAYNSINAYDNGLKFHLQALALRKKMNYYPAISHSLFNVSYTHYLMKDSLDTALSQISQSALIDKSINNTYGLANDYMLIGKIYHLKKNFSESVEMLERSLSLASENNYPEILIETSHELSFIYSELNDYKKAYDHLRIYNSANDSLNNKKNLKQITQLEMQHEFDRKQREISFAQIQEKEIMEERLKRNKVTLDFSLIIGSLVLIFGFFMVLNYRKAKKANKVKELLLKEIHHRVKNNLMVISSLINLQLGSITDVKTRSAVEESQSRVKSMALIHQLLYQSDVLSSINFSKYLEQLMNYLAKTYCGYGSGIKYIIKADKIELDIDTAIPLGLIVNELASNAFKYAFSSEKTGLIEIEFRRLNDKHCHLRIADNGCGIPEGISVDNATTLGLKLVKLLSAQLRGSLNYNSDNGAEFNLTLKRD